MPRPGSQSIMLPAMSGVKPEPSTTPTSISIGGRTMPGTATGMLKSEAIRQATSEPSIHGNGRWK
ncbi:hypothetical protein AB7M37_004945 [Sinorhizobium fredii]